MKRLVVMSLLVVFFVSRAETFSWSETNDMGKPYTTFMGQKNVIDSTSASGTMTTISTADRYYFRENMHMTPTQTDVTCLKITSSNVIVDLRGYTLMGNTTTGAGMIGIEVASNLSNIQIVNGTISSMNGIGVKVNGGCNNIQIRNMQVDQCTLAGVTMDTCNDIHMNEVIITRCNGAHTDAAAEGATGLRLRWCNRIRITDSHFDGNQAGAIDRDAAGVYARQCLHCEFVRCSAIHNKAGSTAGNAGYGFRFLMGSNNAVIKSCKAGCNLTQDGPVYGFCIDDSSGVVMKDCHAQGNMAMGTTDTVDIASGFCISGTGGGGAYLEDCIANKNNGASHVHGFASNYSNHNYFMNCKALDQATSSITTTTVAGFYANTGRGNTFSHCLSFGNTGGANSGSNGTGFYLSGSEVYSNVLECQAKANDGSTGIGYGIWLDSATYCTIRGNELFVNTGTTNGYGVKDSETSSVSAYFENFAYGNGSASGLVVNNFDVTLAPNDSVNDFPVQTAFLTDFRLLKGEAPYDNVELVERADTDSL